MALHDKILAAVVGWAKTYRRVDAVYVYGSFVRSEHTPASDLDLAVLINGRLIQADLDSLRTQMPLQVIWYNDEVDKSVIYLGETMFKLDLIFDDNTHGLISRMRHGGSRAPDVKRLYQKTSSYHEIDQWGFPEADVADFSSFISEGLKFIPYFEAASRYHRRSDGFLFYFHYNLALTCLARMFALLESQGKAKHLYAPRNLLSNLGGSRLAEAKSWHALSGVLYLPDAHYAKKRLADKFAELLERGAVMGIDLPAELKSSPEFIGKIITRDLFFNLRDFSFAYEKSVNPGVLFRGPTITRWQGTKELRQFLDVNDIRHIIDFREISEIQRDNGRLSYDPNILTGRSYVNIPIGDAAIRTDNKSSYTSSLLTNARAFARAYKSLANGKGPCLVHCHVGKDRTGIFCALLGRMLGLPREAIVYDYILSEQGVKAATIIMFLDEIEALGGAEAILNSAGLDDTDLAALRGKLLARH